MANELKVGGFPEWLPSEQLLENKTKNTIANNFEKFGYVNIETPAIERNDVLTAKSGNDVSKQIFGLYGLAQGAEDTKDYSLHFDLTVPLSRYVIDHEGELAFPFKRYQIQKVRRGERSQKGRFKEFYQCDVDVIDKNLSTAYDAEVVYILYNTVEKIFQQLGLDKKFVIQLNNRKLYDAIFGHLGIEADKAKKLMNIFDLYHKIEKADFEKQVKEIIGDTYNNLVQYFDTTILENNNEYPENISKAIQELKEVYEYLQRRGVNVQFDPYIVRGLDYYNGTVFETFIEDNREFGSICSGGRFDNLVGYIRNNTGKKGAEYGGVGGSIGLSRLLFRLKEAGLLPENNSLADVMIFNFDDEAQQYREKITDILRENGMRVDQYLNNDKLGKQFQYAENKNIPYGILAGEKEKQEGKVQLKDLKERTTNNIEVNKIIERLKKNLNNHSLEEILNSRNKERNIYTSYYPWGNPTLFIEGIPYDDNFKKKLNTFVMESFNNTEMGLQNIEQVGFIDSQQKMLMMAWGEFCWNALRSFAYHLLNGQSGEVKIKMILEWDIRELNAWVASDGTARANIPIYENPNKIQKDSVQGNNYIVEMDGITHYINYDWLPFDKDEPEFDKNIKEYTMWIIKKYRLDTYAASGVIYIKWVWKDVEIVPVVYVPWAWGEGTLFVETACWSWTTALALAEATKNNCSIENLEVLQPSWKKISVSVTRDEKGNFTGAKIGWLVEKISTWTFKSPVQLPLDTSITPPSFIIDACDNKANLEYAMNNWCIELYQNLFSQAPYFEKYTKEDVEKIFEEYVALNKNWVYFSKNKWTIIWFGVVVPMIGSSVDEVLSTKIEKMGWNKKDCYYMADMWVTNKYQRYSIGTDLVLSRINNLPSGSIIIMRTSLENYKSQGLYKKLWFKQIDNLTENVNQTRINNEDREDTRLFLYHIK